MCLTCCATKNVLQKPAPPKPEPKPRKTTKVNTPSFQLPLFQPIVSKYTPSLCCKQFNSQHFFFEAWASLPSLQLPAPPPWKKNTNQIILFFLFHPFLASLLAQRKCLACLICRPCQFVVNCQFQKNFYLYYTFPEKYRLG